MYHVTRFQCTLSGPCATSEPLAETQVYSTVKENVALLSLLLSLKDYIHICSTMYVIDSSERKTEFRSVYSLDLKHVRPTKSSM